MNWRRVASRFPEVVVRYRRVAFAAWAIAAAVLLPLARGIEGKLETGTRVPGSESARVAELLQMRFAAPFSNFVVLVVRGTPDPRTDNGQAVLRRVVAALKANASVAQTLSLLDRPDTLFTGADGGTLVLVGMRAEQNPDSILPSLRRTSRALASELRAHYPQTELMWTGELPLTVDLRRVSADDASRAERRVLPLTLLVLVVAFGALAAACIPVASGAIAIGMTMGLIGLLTRFVGVSILALNVSTMLGLGLGIDYALLLVSRFREARLGGLNGEAAAVQAARHAGHSIVLSGSAVLVGFVALLLAPLTDLRSIAIAGILVTGVSVALATTLLPGVLAALGPRIELGRVRRPAGPSAVGPGLWHAWSTVVVRRPLLILIVAGLPTAILAWQWRRLTTGTPSGDWLPPSIESARGLRELMAMRRSGIVYSVRVVVALPDAVSVDRLDGIIVVGAVVKRLEANAHVARVTPSAVSTDKRLVLLDVVPEESTGIAAAMQMVRDIRRNANSEQRSDANSDAQLSVGGLPAFNVDYGNAVARATPRVVATVLLGTFLALLVGFRSVLVPLKAIALNLFSVASAFGAVVLVFQDGHLSRWIGLAAPLDGIFPAVPLLVFCIVFGLSMDYEVFLVSRVAEARRRGASETDAVIEGVSRTGGVITNAAIVMMIVFGAFMMGEFVLMKILGFALAVAVLLDVTVIRLALGPALLRLAGRANWWPGRPNPAALAAE